VTEAYGFSGEKRKEFTHQTSQNLEVISEAGALLTRGFQDISRAWFNLMQERLQKNLEGFNALARCRSVPDFMAVQSSLIRDNLEQTIQSTRQIADVSTRVANEANQTITALTKKARLAA
jgi:phasin family protein